MDRIDEVPVDLLDDLCPMHAVLDATGQVTRAGPALHKISGDAPIIGTRFLDRFELRRPHLAHDMAALRGWHGARLRLRLRAAPRRALKGVVLALPGGGAVVNLSFGISLPEAVRAFGLTAVDFAATDLATEMLYLIEAKSAAMEASRKLNLRLQGARVAAEEKAFTDTLTGLGNRRALEHVMHRLIEGGRDFALLHLDLDFFKQVNDSLGHAAGDHVLRQVARRLLAELRQADLVARVGGDEFVLILSDLAARDDVVDLAVRMIARLEEEMPFDGQICRVSASIGATLRRNYDAPSLDLMMEDADLALYAAKAQGRGCAILFEPGLRATPAPGRPDLPDPPGGAA